MRKQNNPVNLLSFTELTESELIRLENTFDILEPNLYYSVQELAGWRETWFYPVSQTRDCVIQLHSFSTFQ